MAPRLDLFDVLIRDHRIVDSLFAQMLSLCEDGDEADGEQLDALFELLEEKLLAHAEAEDIIVYERFAAIPALAEPMRKAREEHGVVALVLEELTALDTQDIHFHAKLEVLQEMVQHHVQEEEGEVFPVAADEIGATESHRMAVAYLDLIRQITGEDSFGRHAEAHP